MKKTFIAIVMAITVMSVMVMGAAKAFAATYSNSAVVATDEAKDVSRVNDYFRSVIRYVEANPNWDIHVVKMMIHHNGDEVVVSTAWVENGEMVYETYRYDVEDIDELATIAAVIDGYYMCHYWMV